MKINIYSIKQILFQDEAVSLNAKSIAGEITILENHIPFITELALGPIKIVDKNGVTHIIGIESGFLEVKPGEVTVLCRV